jgi:RNA polymerase sigma-70 factor (ECF subfamily)
MKALGAMLADDISVYSDGGGKRPAGPRTHHRLRRGHELQERLSALFRENGSKLVRAGFINGLPGFVTLEATASCRPTR